jgi:hypothetical protein
VKTVLIVVGLAGVALVAGVQAVLLQKGGASMTHEELFSRTVEAFQEVPFLEWTPCGINADYRYATCFVREEGQGQNELNAVLPTLLEKRGLKLSGIQSGQSTSGGAVYAPGLEPYRVGVTINEFTVSLSLSGERLYVGTVWPEGKDLQERYAYKPLREAARDIAALLLSPGAALKHETACNSPSEGTYCVSVNESASEILKKFAEQFYFSARAKIRAGYETGAFKIVNKDEQYDFYHVKIAYQKVAQSDVYRLFLARYERYEFTLTYTPGAAEGNKRGELRVEAAWIEGYTPPKGEEK